MENRRARESFTRVLKRIAKNISEQQCYSLDWNLGFINKYVHTKLRLKSIWVAGSYARGSLYCGDLDLIIDIVPEEGPLPSVTKISRTVIGNAPDVRLYIGTPDSNTSGIEFDEARLIWSHSNQNWQDAIKSIPIDPCAHRYQRRYDLIPLRREQLFEGDIDLLESIVDMKEQELLAWEWIPVEEINVNADNWSNDSKKMFERAKRSVGKKTLAVIELVIEWLQQHNIGGIWEREFGENCHFKACGAEVFLGCPPTPIELLNALSCSLLIIAPHLSRRGPNGLWVISRGNKHPIELTLSSCSAYYITSCNEPCLYFGEIDNYSNVVILDLFKTKELAYEHIEEEIEDNNMGCDMNIKHVCGKDLGIMISCTDIISIKSSTDTFFDLLITENAVIYDNKEADNDSSISDVYEISTLLSTEQMFK